MKRDSLSEGCRIGIVGTIIAFIIPVVPVNADSCFLKVARVTGHNVLGKALTEKETKQITDMITIGVNKDLIDKYTYGQNPNVSPDEDKPTWSRKIALDAERVESENIEYIWNNVRELLLEGGGPDLRTKETHFSFYANKWKESTHLEIISDAKLSKIQEQVKPLKRLVENLIALARNTYPNAKGISANLVFTPDSVINTKWHQHHNAVTLVAQLKKGGKMTRLNNEMKPERGDLVALVGPHASAEEGSGGPRVVLVIFIRLS